MANTYSQIYLHIVFAVKGRQYFIIPSVKDELEKYICGIVENKMHKPLAIFCMPDHLHLLVGFNPVGTISDLVKAIKVSSTEFIKEKRLLPPGFHWQIGFGVFSYSKSQLNAVIGYILNQQAHHKKKTFEEEYIEFLKKFEISFKDEYLFEFYEA